LVPVFQFKDVVLGILDHAINKMQEIYKNKNIILQRLILYLLLTIFISLFYLVFLDNALGSIERLLGITLIFFCICYSLFNLVFTIASIEIVNSRIIIKRLFSKAEFKIGDIEEVKSYQIYLSVKFNYIYFIKVITFESKQTLQNIYIILVDSPAHLKDIKRKMELCRIKND